MLIERDEDEDEESGCRRRVSGAGDIEKGYSSPFKMIESSDDVR